MKKSLLMAGVAVIALTTSILFTSCRKSFNCDCVTYDSKGNPTQVGTFTFNEWRDDAQNLCNYKQSNGFPTSAVPVTCELK
jgi:hypothetical protein